MDQQQPLSNNDSFSNMAVENPKEEAIKAGSEIDSLPIEVKKSKHKAELP